MRNPSEDEVVEQALAALRALNKPKRATRQEEQERRRWPSRSTDTVEHLGKPHAKLFPFIGRKVRTPAGPGTLLQVFADRTTVFLDSELEKAKEGQVLSYFEPAEVEPVSWELE